MQVQVATLTMNSKLPCHLGTCKTSCMRWRLYKAIPNYYYYYSSSTLETHLSNALQFPWAAMTMSRSVSTETESMTHNKRLQNAWNHASFLINEAYDWERAAKQFESLERVVSHRLVKAILLLNIGITYSLLADYRQAEKAFQKVLPLHHFISPLAHYMLGLVRFELADYWQAQISFKLCACVLYQTGHLRDYRHLGLDFTLSHHLVVENEEMAAHEWTLQHKGRRGVRVLNRLPAPVMFDSTVLDSLAGAGCEGPIRPRVDGHASPSSVYSTHLAAIPSISATHATINHTLGSAPTTRVPPQIPRRPVRKQHMLPRAAQPETCDLRELAHFLKYTGPSNQVSSEVRTTTSTSISQRLSAVRTNTSNTTTSLTRPAVPLSEVATSVDARPGVFRKFSSQTLKR
jgi:hypothetical protein